MSLPFSDLNNPSTLCCSFPRHDFQTFHFAGFSNGAVNSRCVSQSCVSQTVYTDKPWGPTRLTGLSFIVSLTSKRLYCVGLCIARPISSLLLESRVPEQCTLWSVSQACSSCSWVLWQYPNAIVVSKPSPPISALPPHKPTWELTLSTGIKPSGTVIAFMLRYSPWRPVIQKKL